MDPIGGPHISSTSPPRISSARWHATRPAIDRPQLRHLGPAPIDRVRAPRMERASRWRVRRIRHRAGQHDPRPPGREVDLRHGRAQRQRVRVGRPREDLLRRAVLDDTAEVQHRGLLAELLDHRQVVRDQHVGEPAFAPELGDELEDPRLHRDVERARRLVEDQHPGLDRERAGDRHALALAARELVRVAPGHLGIEADLGQQRSDPIVDLRSRNDPRGPAGVRRSSSRSSRAGRATSSGPGTRSARRAGTREAPGSSPRPRLRPGGSRPRSPRRAA